MGLVGSGRVDASNTNSPPTQALLCLTACLTSIAHKDPTASRRVILLCAQVYLSVFFLIKHSVKSLNIELGYIQKGLL